MKNATSNSSVGTPGTGTSTEDEDGQGTGSGFEEFATAAYANGNNSTALTYYTTDSCGNATAYYNSSGVNQILADGTYLVIEQTDPNALGAAGANSQRTSPQTESKAQLVATSTADHQLNHTSGATAAVVAAPGHANTVIVTISNAANNGPAALLINPSTVHSVSESTNHNNHNNTAITTQAIAVTNPTIAAVAAVPPVNIHSTNNNNSSIGQNQSLHHQQNVRDMDIVHVQWLLENYETAEGVSLPRSTLYTHYQNHCTQHNIEPVNAASFGKLIRSVFIGLRTRRLGTRGNSKYHYYGIRVKPGSTLSRIESGASSPPATPDPVQPTPPKKQKLNANSTITTPIKPQQPASAAPGAITENHQATLTATLPEVLQTHLGDPKTILPSVWPEEPTLPANQDSDAPGFLATKFAAAYRKHYEEIINALGSLQFNQVEQIWQKFWQPESGEKSSKIQEEKSSKKLTLTISQLHQLTTTAPVADDSAVQSLADWIIQTDYTLYNALISSLLLPNLLKPIPQQLTQQIRNFAKNVTAWMTSALVGYDQSFIALKVGAVGAFSHTLRRYTSLNHLSSAARAVLQNQQQISQMITDLNRVDFKNVQEQASWVCQCDDEIVDQIEMSFKDLLQQDNPFDRWGLWCEQILDSCLHDSEVKSATQFFFKWGFYSSLVMRDLTLRSASSFGSFHLIRLLFDEYLFYLIEHRVAKATSKTPLQVLGEARTLRNQNHLDAASTVATSEPDGPSPN